MDCTVQKAVALAPLTTLQVGGTAETYVRVTDEQTLVAAVQYASDNQLPITILGGGSNVLIPDAGVSGLVIHNAMTEYSVEISDDEVLVTAGAGETLDAVIEKTVAEGWWGLENLSHIPGSVGATPVQNVGAYGVEVADVIASVRVYDVLTNTFLTFSVADCAFGYRDSLFKQTDGKRYIVTAVTYRLSKTAAPKLEYRDLTTAFPDGCTDQAAIRSAVIAIRAKKFPDWNTVGTAGSFFKNPVIPKSQYAALCTTYPELPAFPVSDTAVKVPLGYILDKILGYKGKGTDTVGTYAGQALVLINKGGATAADIVAFADEITTTVAEQLAIDIEWEVTQIQHSLALKIDL